jgi:RimJ/RimL family protein N-acetyltransferase
MIGRFRKINKSDYPALLKFFKNNRRNEFFDPFPLTHESAKKIIEPDRKNLYYGIFLKNNLIGFAMLRWWQNFNCPTLGLLVDKEYRGQGIGKRIYAFLFKKAGEKKCKNISALVYKTNTVSCHIAKKSGMKEINKRKPYLAGEYDFKQYLKSNRGKTVLIKNL